ncbi:MAG: tetratricopeptide repeat protein [Candidatus Omnitrophota bacterium]|nr:tetratricopeptide repeat protein [Candidatus Omnitrophota bacterium]
MKPISFVIEAVSQFVFFVIARRPLGRRSNLKIDCFGCLWQPRNDAILTVVFIFLFSSICFAQVSEAPPTFQKAPDEEAEFIFAKKAFSDGFYSLAQDNLEDFLKKYPATDYLYEAHLLLGRALYYQNNFKRSHYEFDIVLSAPNASGFEDSALYWSGDMYFKGRDFKKALEAYQKVLDDYPASKYYGNAVYSKGWSYYKLGLFEDAMAAFREVGAKYYFEKIGMESLFKIGECEYLMNRYPNAEKTLSGFIEKYPLSEKAAESYYLMADARFKQGDYADSVSYFNRAISIASMARWSRLALYRMAQGYFEIKNYDESLKKFEESASNSKNAFLISNSLLGMARNHERMGALEDSLRICNDVITKFPKSDASSEAYYIKAGILSDQKRYKEAAETCLKGIDKFLSPAKTGKLHYQLGCIYLKDHGSLKEALGEFDTAIENLKSELFISGALCKIGDIYLGTGDYDKAMNKYDMVLKSYSNTAWAPHAQAGIGNIFLATKKFDQAILAFQSTLVNFPQTRLKERVIFNLGLAYFNKEDFLRAAEEFKKLPDTRARFYLANSLYNAGRYDDALEIFTSIAKNSSDTLWQEPSQYQISWCLYRMGQDMGAVDHFKAFLKKYPDSKFSPDALRISTAILSGAAKNFERWGMPGDAARVQQKLKEFELK